MKRPATFKQNSRLFMDSWISSPDGLADPESHYGHVRGMLRPNMILLVINTRGETRRIPSGFHRELRPVDRICQTAPLAASRLILRLPRPALPAGNRGSGLCRRRRTTAAGDGAHCDTDPRRARGLWPDHPTSEEFGWPEFLVHRPTRYTLPTTDRRHVHRF